MSYLAELRADPPIGYGVDDQDECPDCGLRADDCLCYSPCCGAKIIHEDLCSECKEHI